MKLIREVLRLFSEKCSMREISRRTQVSRHAVQDYLFRAGLVGITWPIPDEIDDCELEARLFPVAPRKKPSALTEPNWAEIDMELRRDKEATLTVLHQEYLQSNPNGLKYSSFCERFRAYRKSTKTYMRMAYKAGEYAFVDFVGRRMPVYFTDGSVQEMQIFVGVLGASGLIYAEAVPSQKVPHWLVCHTHMYEAWGGTPQIVVPDNLKSAVIRTDRYAPTYNESYADHSSHYRVSIIAARPRKPKDKAPAERAVQFLGRSVLYPLRKMIFTSLAELNAEISKGVEKINRYASRRVGKSRYDLFLQLDKPALHPLPIKPYEYAEYAMTRVTDGYHFLFEHHEYSVPFSLAGKQIKVRATAHTVEAYCEGRRIASHSRSHIAGGVTTDNTHRHPDHAAYANWDRVEAMRQAELVGPACLEFLISYGKQANHIDREKRASGALQKNVREYGVERVERACKRALRDGAIQPRYVSNLLRNNRESLPTQNHNDDGVVIMHRNLRAKEDFGSHPNIGEAS